MVAPPFISVPPKVYGGTELFVAHLAEGLAKRGIEVIVYCNGESTVAVEKRWLYRQAQWPINGEVYANLKDINHTSWAVRDASDNCCDVVHLNNLPGLATSRFVNARFVYTIHHPSEPGLSAFYDYYPDVQYVTISNFQRRRETMPNIRTIHHGIDLSLYKVQEKKSSYLSFLGRIAPIKGTHLAIEVAKKAGIPLKIAGEIQPVFRDYYETEIKPHIDGKFIEYVGEADLATKNELLGNSVAMLFPIQWDEPFGLVMIESMACGTPVLAMPGGAVQEVIADGVSGWVCRSTADMANKARDAATDFQPSSVRAFVARYFSIDVMVENYAQCYADVLNVKQATIEETQIGPGEPSGHRAAA